MSAIRPGVSTPAGMFMTLLRVREWVQMFPTCWARAVQIARRCIGVPDYDTYLRHQREHHPHRTPMSYSEFFTERQNARYKGGGGRCC